MFIVSFFDLVLLKYRNIINYACYFSFHCIYSQLNVSFMLSYKQSVSDFLLHLFFFVTIFSHRGIPLCLYLIFSPSFYSIKPPDTFQNVYICFVYAFLVHRLFDFLSPDMYEAVILAYYAIKPYFL